MSSRTELNAEIRRARGWLVGVGILMFAMDLLFLHVVYSDELTEAFKQDRTIIAAGVLGLFVALAVFTSRKPRLCLGLSLAVFWGLQLYNSGLNPTVLMQGIIVKLAFTYALVKGLAAASRAQLMLDDLEKVFE